MTSVLLLILATTGWAPATPAAGASPSPGTPSPGVPVCTVDDPRATELSGLVSSRDGYAMVNDSNEDSDAVRLFQLDPGCGLTGSVGYPTRARDPEDLALGRDGTLWIADIGDNATSSAQQRRATIALWRVPAAGGTPVIHRLTYPDGAHDAEALVLDKDDAPVIVTKEPSGTAGVYVPTGALRAGTADGVPLRRAGSFTPQRTGTPAFLGALGDVLVTGGANAPDRRRVALRTYGDAYEWDVPDGDVVAAITSGTPRVTPLPGEPQGESIAYTPDGSAFLTVSDEPGATTLRRYTPNRPRPSTAASAVAGRAGDARGDGFSWRLLAGAAAGVAGAALLLVLVLRARRRRS